MLRRVGAAGAFGAIALTIAISGQAGAGFGEVPAEDLGKSHGLRYLVGEFEPFTQDLFISVECPTFSEAAGGGGDVSGKPKQSRVNGSIPDGAFWDAEAQTLVKTERAMKVYGICHPTGDLSDNLNEIVDVPPGATRTLEVDCVGNSRPLGGGPVLSLGSIRRSEPFDDEDANKLPDDGWVVKARNDSAVTPDLEVGVVCLQASAGAISYETERAEVKRNKAKTVKASCPRSRAVSGGGFSIARGAESFVHSLVPADSKADGNKTPDDQYKATVVNKAAGKSKATATAICLH